MKIKATFVYFFSEHRYGQVNESDIDPSKFLATQQTANKFQRHSETIMEYHDRSYTHLQQGTLPVLHEKTKNVNVTKTQCS